MAFKANNPGLMFMKYLSVLFATITFSFFACAMEKTNELISLNSNPSLERSDLNLDALPNDLLKEIIPYLIEWDALTEQEAKKHIAPFKKVNKHFKKLAESMEKKIDSMLKDIFWKSIEDAQQKNDHTKIKKAMEMLNKRADLNIAYKDCFPHIRTHAAIHQDDYSVEEELNSILKRKDQEYVQAIPSKYQTIASKALAQIRDERVERNVLVYHKTQTFCELIGVIIFYVLPVLARQYNLL